MPALELQQSAERDQFHFQDARSFACVEKLDTIYNMAMLMSNSMPMKLSGSSALVTLLHRQNIRTLFCSTPRFEKKKEPSKKYSSTLLLPKTSFPMKVEGKKRIARDKEISEKCKFDSQYSRQRQNRYMIDPEKKSKNNYFFRTGPEYILHDGPPYANGSPHLGHAVNKILKDITGRWVGNKKPQNMLLIQYSSQGFTVLVVNGSTGCQVYIKGSD